MRRFLAVAVLVAAPSAGRADDITSLYPADTVAVACIDIKATMNSPLGKRVFGTDKPFDATRKLVKVLFPDVDGILPLDGDAAEPIAAVFNKLQRVTAVVTDQHGVVIFLEGEIDEAAFVKAAEAIAKVRKRTFRTPEFDNRKQLVLDKGARGDRTWGWFGSKANKSLFVIASQRDLLFTVLRRHDTKPKANLSKQLAAALKKVKPADSPVWAALGTEQLDVSGVATVALKENIDFRVELLGEESLATTVKESLEAEVEKQAKEPTPQGNVWKAAGIVIKQDGKTVVATGSISGKLLAEEYAKQK